MKAFMLFLLYSTALLLMTAAILLCSAVVTHEVNVLIALVFLTGASIFALMIGSFGLKYVPEVCQNNRTTIERIAGSDPETYNVGTRQNIEQVFGETCWLWVLPIPPRFSGFAWSRNDLRTGGRDDAL
jgi:hypothetical protein